MWERYKGTSPAPQSTKQSEKTSHTPFNLALVHAERTTGGVLADLLREAGDPTPAVGMKTILIALVDAGAPLEKLVDLAYLGRNRVRRFLARGGRIKTTLPGFYINLMRNLANEAKGKRWDTVLIELEDQIKHEEALRRLASRGAGTPQEQQQAPAELDQEALDEEKAAPEGTAASQRDRKEESPPAKREADRPNVAHEGFEVFFGVAICFIDRLGRFAQVMIPTELMGKRRKHLGNCMSKPSLSIRDDPGDGDGDQGLHLLQQRNQLLFGFAQEAASQEDLP